MNPRKRIVLTVAGSDSDGKQMIAGLKFLNTAYANGDIGSIGDLGAEFRKLVGTPRSATVGHFTLSAHRNNKLLVSFCGRIARMAKKNLDIDYMLVMGAGMAAILSGLAAAILYQEHGVTNVFVVAVAFESFPSEESHNMQFNVHQGTNAMAIYLQLSKKQRRDMAAITSIMDISDNLMITGDATGIFFGSDGFSRACKIAVNGNISDNVREGVCAIKKKPAKFRPWAKAVEQFSKAM